MAESYVPSLQNDGRRCSCGCKPLYAGWAHHRLKCPTSSVSQVRDPVSIPTKHLSNQRRTHYRLNDIHHLMSIEFTSHDMAQASSIGTALVTGASSGLGHVYARRLASRGFDLILVARDGGRMTELADKVKAATGQSAEVLPADLTRSDDVDLVAKRLREDADINLLVNNAGMSLNGGILDNDDESLRKLIALNVTAVTVLAAAAAQAFPGRRDPAIVNVGSVLSFMAERFEGVYSGSKAFVLNLTQSLATQLEARVRVQAVIPGATRTEIWARSGKDVDAFPPEIVMSAVDLVDAALVGLDRGEAVSIPSLADERQWIIYEEARTAMAPNLNNRDVARRYNA